MSRPPRPVLIDRQAARPVIGPKRIGIILGRRQHDRIAVGGLIPNRGLACDTAGCLPQRVTPIEPVKKLLKILVRLHAFRLEPGPTCYITAATWTSRGRLASPIHVEPEHRDEGNLAVTRIPLSKTEEQARKLEENLNLSTAEIGLQVRTTNCLEEKGIFTVRDLLNSNPAELLSIQNFGEKTLEEVYQRLADLGYHRLPSRPK